MASHVLTVGGGYRLNCSYFASKLQTISRKHSIIAFRLYVAVFVLFDAVTVSAQEIEFEERTGVLSLLTEPDSDLAPSPEIFLKIFNSRRPIQNPDDTEQRSIYKGSMPLRISMTILMACLGAIRKTTTPLPVGLWKSVIWINLNF